jgi:soluble lytic murein transglycosylase
MRIATCLTGLALSFGACASPEATRETASTVTEVIGGREDVVSSQGPDGAGDTTQTDAADTADTAPPEAIPVPTPGPEAPPVLSDLTPWFAGAAFQPALAAYDAGRPLDAVAVLDTWVSAHPEDPRQRPARFFAAWILAELGDAPPPAGAPAPTLGDVDVRQAAADRFAQLVTDWPVLGEFAALREAELRLALGDPDKARLALAKVGDDAAFIGRVLALESQVAGADGRTKVLERLEAAAKKTPERLLPESWAMLAELRTSTPGGPRADLARVELVSRFPTHALGQAALQALSGVKLSGAERLRIAKGLFEAWRFEAMRGVLAPLIAAKKADPEACEAWVLAGRAAERKKKDDKDALDKAFALYEKALACHGEVRADATFLAGRARVGTNPKEGRKLLEAHAKEFPNRSTADDALLLLAETEKKPKAATKALLNTLRRYPQGDMADSVAWDLVGPHIEARDWKKALEALDQVLRLVPDDIPGRHPGRFRYWRGRALWELGQKDEALVAWRTVFEKHPLSWYALLANARLAAADPEAAKALVPASPETPPTTPAVPEKLWQDRHFRLAVEWSRLAGASYDRPSPLLPWVDAELDAVAPAVRPTDWAWTRVAVQQLGGGYPPSIRTARTLEATTELAFPVGLAALPWKLAYPRPYVDLVTRWAKTRAIDPNWVWSIMRVESNFDPTAVSWANAIGLMQIILPTAKSLARDTPHAPTRENLMRPAVAIELGTKYLEKLLGRHKVIPLASAGYNAGGGAVSKWRKQFGDVDLDEFVERIPYREANLYAKSVTQTLARYLWLYQGELLALDLRPIGAPEAAAAPTE